MICPHCKKKVTFRVSDENIKEIFKLSKQGFSLRDIDRMLGVSYSTVHRILKNGDIKELFG